MFFSWTIQMDNCSLQLNCGVTWFVCYVRIALLVSFASLPKEPGHRRSYWAAIIQIILPLVRRLWRQFIPCHRTRGTFQNCLMKVFILIKYLKFILLARQISIILLISLT